MLQWVSGVGSIVALDERGFWVYSVRAGRMHVIDFVIFVVPYRPLQYRIPIPAPYPPADTTTPSPRPPPLHPQPIAPTQRTPPPSIPTLPSPSTATPHASAHPPIPRVRTRRGWPRNHPYHRFTPPAYTPPYSHPKALHTPLRCFPPPLPHSPQQHSTMSSHSLLLLWLGLSHATPRPLLLPPRVTDQAAGVAT